MADSKKFNYAIDNFSDVVKHIDAIWDHFNEIAKIQVCDDPPRTCRTQAEPGRKRPGRAASKRYVKR